MLSAEAEIILRSFLFQNTMKNISICQDMGQMKNISSFHNAFFQEFVSYFQLACITLWLSLSIFHSFQAVLIIISDLSQMLKQNRTTTALYRKAI